MFKEIVKKIEKLEKERVYCRHNLNHFLDVARIGYLYILENSLPISCPQIYGAALLHDIGRVSEYKSGIPHYEAGIGIASGILRDCGYLESEIKEIVEAISKHGSIDHQKQDTLGYVLYLADKKSRLCFACEASIFCHWPKEKKNATITF